MRLIKIFLLTTILLLLSASTTLASSKYKIVIGTFSTQNNANTALENVKNELKTKDGFNLVVHESEKYFTCIAEEFSDKKLFDKVLKEIRIKHPGAFLVKVAEDKKVPKKKSVKKKAKKQQRAKKREQVNVNFANLEINDFIKLISKITNKNILINNKINGTVNFVSTTPVYDDELVGILVSVLESKGFTLVRKGSLYEIVRSTEAAKHNAKVVKQGKRLYGSLMVTQSIKVNGENVDIVAAKIRYLISKTAKLMTMKESNTILVTDYPKNIETIKKVIKDIDTNNKSVVKVIPIKYTEVKKLQTRLVNISKSLFNEKVASQRVKIILDDNINGIIVVGLKSNVKKIEKLVEKLDVESSITKTVHIFELKNSDAKSVLASLTEIISKQLFTDPAMKPNVSASEEINSIIAIGEPIIIKGIKLIIDELDKEKYQVYVQARIIEINKNNSADLGVKYGFDGGTLTSEGLYSFAANFGGGPIAGIVGAELASSVIGAGATQGFALGAAIDFLETHGASTSISNPSILCVNNKESSIYVGKTISVSTGTVTSTTGITGLTSSFKREDVGLTLKIKPRVSSVDKVTLDIETILENILDDGSNNATGQPVTSKQEVKTQAILRHGESIIIGGLVKTYERDSVNKIPLLSYIPVLGETLFTSTSTVEEQDNLVVILTPYVIAKSDKLSQLQKDLGVLSKIQEKYNKEVFQRIEEEGIQDKPKTDVSIDEDTDVESN
jgi:general secretion pathway protein D